MLHPLHNCDPTGITTAPIYEYSHNAGRCSVTGGYVYRGCELQGFDGSYFFADFCSSEVWSFEFTNDIVQNFQLRLNMSAVSSFGVDGRGELYICQLNGSIYRMVFDGPPATCNGCCQTPGDADHDGSFNVVDITFAIARIFSGGPAPQCQDEIDADGNNAFSIADITYMIARIFSGGAPPICGTTGS